LESSTLILAHLLQMDRYYRKVSIHLQSEYFQYTTEDLIFTALKDYHTKYNCLPTKDEITVLLNSKNNLPESLVQGAMVSLEDLYDVNCREQSFDAMYDMAEDFAKDRALNNALAESISIMDGANKNVSTTAIPTLLSEALAVTFNTSVGHDYLEDAAMRFQYYQSDEEKIPFDLSTLNKATGGGVPSKTFNLILGGVNVGKSLILCHLAASYLTSGSNVLFISLEMDEFEIAKRIDANILDHNINELRDLEQAEYDKKIINSKARAGEGKLIIQQYAPLSVSSHHIENLIDELKLKKNFVPDILIIDYIGLLGSQRLANNGSVNTNTFFKYVSEEVRAVAIKRDLISWTANQFNRTGFASSDPDLDDAAESFGVTATADLIIAAISDDDLASMQQYLFKILKTRYTRKDTMRKFNIGVNYDRMKLYDLPEFLGFGNLQKSEKEEPKNKKDDIIF